MPRNAAVYRRCPTSTHDSLDRPHVGIVGGGLAGLVLARVLTRGGVRVTVLERDATPDARSQGGSLDLHPKSGQRALVPAGLTAQFRRHARPQGEEIRILDPAGHQHVHHRGAGTSTAVAPDAEGILPGRPEIDRAALRALLCESVPADVVRWGRRVTGITARPSGGWQVQCDDVSRHDVNVLVGADGAWSRVRGLLTDVRPEPVGVTLATLWLRDPRRHPALDALLGDGILWCLGDDLNVGAQRGGDGEARVSVMARDTPAGSPIPPNAGKQDILALLRSWSPRIRDLVAAADDDVSVYEITALPTTLTWASRPDLTLVGDAAHLMPPVGEGANQAMLDAAELGRALVGAVDTGSAIGEAIHAADAAMFARVHPIAERSAEIQATIVSPHALAAMTRTFGG